MSKRSSMYRDSRWQQRRLEIMERDNWTCRSCGGSGDGTFLNVHHAYYEAGRKPWEYPPESLITWCNKCHEKRHKMLQMLQEEMAKLPEKPFAGLFNIVYGASYEEVFELFANGPFPEDFKIKPVIECALAFV